MVEVNSKKDFEVEESINGIMTRRIARDLVLFYTSALNFPKGEFVPFFEHSKEEWEEYIHYLIKEVADDPEREIEVVPNRKRSVFEIFNAHR